jgi:hypothetical protein
MKTPIPVPDPLPAPLPGGGPQDGYQFLFDKRYYETRKKALEPFSYGFSASPFADTPQLDPDAVDALAAKLYDWKAPGGPGVYGPDHVDFDQEIDNVGAKTGEGEPYAVMYQRQEVLGYQRVPIGTGATTQPPEVVNPADLQGPPVPGQYLLVTCDINLL